MIDSMQKRSSSKTALAACLAVCAAAFAAAQEAIDSAPARPVVARRPVVALALEGGGALGLAHIGVIKVIEELGIPVDIVTGTSMGSIVAGAYAMGYDARSMEAVVASADWADLFSERSSSRIESYRENLDRSRYFASVNFDSQGFLFGGGLLTGRKVLSFLDSIAVAAPSPVEFDDLPRRYRAVAADVLTGEKVIFERGSVSDAMRASMSIPGVFAPYELGGRYFVDGGVVDNLPIRTARELGADLVIAVDLRGGKPVSADSVKRNPLDTITRTMDIFIDANVIRQLNDADLVLQVDLAAYLAVDFQDSAAILAAGEKAARDHIGELSSFADRVREGGTGAEARNALVRARPKFEALEVEGGTEKERELAYELFAPVIGKEFDPEALAEPVARLYQSGRFDSVRLHRGAGTEEGTLIVRLEDAPPRGHELRIGLSYEGTYSSAPTNRLSMFPGVIFRGLTTRDSRLAIDVEFLDALAVGTSFKQPFANRFFAEAFFEYRRDFNPYLSDPSNDYRSQVASAKTGLHVGSTPYPGVEFSCGLGYDWIDESRLLDVEDAVDTDGVVLLGTDFAVRRLDSPIFPMSGFWLDLGYRVASPLLGADDAFRVFTTAGSVFLSLHTPFSVALSWKGGTDFSDGSSGWKAAPDYYKPNLADRRLFPAALGVEEKIGSHTAGVGLETKYRLTVMSGLVGLPVFLLAHGAAGFALQEPADAEAALDALHWNAAIGAGVRFSDAFGLSLRGGAHRESSGDFVPFFAVDIGSIGY